MFCSTDFVFMLISLLSAPICQNKFLVGVNLLGNKNNSYSDSERDREKEGEGESVCVCVCDRDMYIEREQHEVPDLSQLWSTSGPAPAALRVNTAYISSICPGCLPA